MLYWNLEYKIVLISKILTQITFNLFLNTVLSIQAHQIMSRNSSLIPCKGILISDTTKLMMKLQAFFADHESFKIAF